MSKVVLIFADEDLSSIYMEKNKDMDFLDVLKGKLFPPLGLLYIASILEKEGISVTVLDTQALGYSFKRLMERIRSEDPQVVGFSVQSANLHNIYQIIKGIRKFSKNKIILGGPHVSYSPEAVKYLDADYGIIGDGEYLFKEVVKSILGNIELPLLPGLVKKEGNLIAFEGKARIDDLDQLPYPARHLWPHHCFSPLLANNVATLLTSRGCIYNCIFCGLPDKGEVRTRSVDNVLEEFDFLYQKGYRYIELQDDIFSYDRNRVIKLCSGLIDRDLDIRWTCVTRADYVDYELLKIMEKAGCTHVKFGIECASDKLRNQIIGKSISSQKIREGIIAAKKAKINTVGYFVIGIPKETLDDIKETIRFAYSLGLDYLDFHLTLIISGSRLFDLACKEGKIKKEVWKDVALGKPIPIYISDGLNIKDMQKLITKGLLNFYFSFNFLFKEVFIRTRDWRTFLNKLRLVWHMIKSIFQKIIPF